MSELFKNPHATDMAPDNEELIRVLKWGRQYLKHSEDDWVADELTLVRQQLPSIFHQYDLHEMHVRMIRLRKDKLVRKKMPVNGAVRDLAKIGRDLRKRQEAFPNRHSPEYLATMNDPFYRSAVDRMKEECEGRCQLCGRRLPLEAHHTPLGYSYLGREKPCHLLCLCAECHSIADAIRERHN